MQIKQFGSLQVQCENNGDVIFTIVPKLDGTPRTTTTLTQREAYYLTDMLSGRPVNTDPFPPR